MGTKAFVGCGIIAALVGITLVILGTVVLPKEDPKLMTSKLNDYLTVDSSRAALYERWAGGFDDLLDYQMIFYFYNLTNVDDVLAGQIPNYTQHGPYVWRRYRQAVNVSFPDNGNQVEYSEHTIYQFEADESTGTPDDLFTNVNPAYVGAVTIAGSELNLIPALSGGYIGNITNYFTNGYVKLLGAVDFAPYFIPLLNDNIQAINATVQNTDQAFSLFYSAWANSTSLPNTPGNWTAMLISYNQTQPSNISLASCQMLFDPSFSGSLLDTSAGAIDTWNQASYDDNIATQVAASFNMSTNQVKYILNWKNNVFVPTEIYPSWILKYGLDQASDIGWLQFAYGTPMNGQAVQTTYPKSYSVDPGYGLSAEIWSVLGSNVTSDWVDWRNVAVLFNPEVGLANVTLFQDAINPAVTQHMLNLTANQIQDMLQYALTWAAEQALPDVMSVNGPTAGLIATKSIHQWIFDCHDIVIDLLRNPAPTCNMLFNDTTFAPNILWTGKADISKIDTYINYQGAPTVDGVFAGPLDISNKMIYTELGQFAPNLPVGGKLQSFDPHFMRPIQLNYTSNVSVVGLNTFKYVLDPYWTFAADPYLYQEGIGFGNVTGAQNDSPIFLSLWDQKYVGQCFPPINYSSSSPYNCSSSYNPSSVVVGQNATNDDNDSAILHIEPQTGVTLEAFKRLQVNLHVADKSIYTSINNNGFQSGKETYYPLSKAGEHVIVSQDLADEIKNKLAIIPKLNNAMFYVGVTVGPVFVVLGIIMIAIGLRKKRRGYSAINE
eukprot:TRINITY_DN3141_c0_g1_i1.p1 TRINITY_DN3141_c0_g1~~TRINITY_DN3141_c0_g1_i1.p1  ORF type:complete len:775 (-),score=224.26 TRINITY_DN3141_c0_g1_i1:729-3053(-)